MRFTKDEISRAIKYAYERNAFNELYFWSELGKIEFEKQKEK